MDLFDDIIKHARYIPPAIEDYCIHGRYGWCEFCESENEDLSNKIHKLSKKAEADILAREKFKADIEFSRLPWWVQQAEEGDYMSDGSDLQEYDPEDKLSERSI